MKSLSVLPCTNSPSRCLLDPQLPRHPLFFFLLVCGWIFFDLCRLTHKLGSGILCTCPTAESHVHQRQELFTCLLSMEETV